MASFTEIAELIPTLRGHLSGDSCVDDVLSAVSGMTDAEVVAILEEVVHGAKLFEQIKLSAIGVGAARSTRERGHSGLAQSRGHRSMVELVRHITGSTRGEAAREVRVGAALLEHGPEVEGEWGAGGAADRTGGGRGHVDDGAEGQPGAAGGPGPNGESGADAYPGTNGEFGADRDRAGDQGGGFESGNGADSTGESDGAFEGGRFPKPPAPWHEPLRVALRTQVITTAQFDAIRGGLGEPPVTGDDDAATAKHAREAWTCAAEQLIAEANERTVEELRSAARALRDQLDPEGAEARFLAQYEARSFRIYRDAEGRKRGSVVFDEESGAFVDAFINAAMRPRRGGPRFVDSEERAKAAELVDDQRTNDQLTFDLIMDVLRAGVLADAASVFGTRQAGVRLVHAVEADGSRAPIVHTEDGLIAMPASIATQRMCESGSVQVTVDSCGNPLDVGREQRLFTSKQRVALAIRDGGCRWRGCDRPASYCEAHHIDEWARDHGRTNIDRGILLCRYHHMTLHNGGWWITRDGTGDFVLHHPGGDEFVLRPRAVLAYTYAQAWPGFGADPPPKRFRPAAA
ncbi:HNH endonuclease signature motif containing protein [Microbacterium sp.]|uniref:HNH endonuclease signature motif containing protein n=1 Tax=Microbacterium sp. TaxID=51671 RepID=UPI00273249D7|nr:HNH endonuclease signature motif containing protein [Microbacterium sp.]MDP3950377.1 HNH endonuclease signature motif containing protein [Microbacterium sp.]